jgi:23S rRNA pseudouridine2605 synthase
MDDDRKKFPPRDRQRPTGERREGGQKPFAKRGTDRPGGGTRPRPSDSAAEAVPGERIAKRLARAGIASRRDAEDLIAAGRVAVNGKKLTSPAFNVMPDDAIEVDGTAIPPIERTRLFLFHKPAGVVTTNRDPEGRRTVFDVLPADLPRLMTIGRLDINTEGLLLLTNDGGLARVLELPATGWLRRYRVRVHGKVEEKALAGLKDGIAVDGVFYGSIEASLDREQGSNAWLSIGLREGKNREVKNILGALGLEVSRLIRVSYGPFQLGELAEGHVQEIKGRMLRDQLGERLIEEAGANFEAPVVNTFSNSPVRRAPEAVEEAPRPKIMRDGERGRIGEGGLIKRRQRREGERDKALGKLSTRPERGSKFERGDTTGRGPRPPRAGKPEREQRPIEPPGGRKANVWMAPGARPIGTGRAAAEKADAEAKRAARRPVGPRSFRGADDGAPRAARSPRWEERGNSSAPRDGERERGQRPPGTDQAKPRPFRGADDGAPRPARAPRREEAGLSRAPAGGEREHAPRGEHSGKPRAFKGGDAAAARPARPSSRPRWTEGGAGGGVKDGEAAEKRRPYAGKPSGKFAGKRTAPGGFKGKPRPGPDRPGGAPRSGPPKGPRGGGRNADRRR